jgi:membrane protein implicated in regulation of membrane protease activity
MLETTFFYCAVVGGIFLLLQIALMFMGGDDGGDFDVGGDVDASFGPDGDGSGHDHGFWFFEMVSLRTLTAAATFYGLVGLAAHSSGLNPLASVTLALAAGFASMFAVYWSFKKTFQMLNTSGNEDIRNAIGAPAHVYVPIPASGAGRGKVHVVVQGRTAEYQAVTDGDVPFATGDQVQIIAVVNNDTVSVASVHV